ncbi:hypothetical protein RHSIM_Rhsim02G0149700 [Rhododendron simsii]|uniref:Uncharacterized protein n=1 Tax=Rhododendron simsii TaxID=118357 RepID=A0A834HAL8_RHOSS|nr:hypothetical protein RHSIM_Rhsim02G0149700 [Rhododendron simsii]
MKQSYSIMSLLIPGPIAPGRDIDVYLRPLIDELKELWERGAVTYDASTPQTFRMHVAVMWTINVFLAWLRSKLGYVGARRWLPKDHPWRRSHLFDGKVDHQKRPMDLTGEQILQQMNKGTYKPFGKHPSNKRKRGDPILNWTKKSIFFELPYWEKLLLQHNLDVMHIEKNIFEALLGILLSIDGKNKGTEKARQTHKRGGQRPHIADFYSSTHYNQKKKKWIAPICEQLHEYGVSLKSSSSKRSSGQSHEEVRVLKNEVETLKDVCKQQND